MSRRSALPNENGHCTSGWASTRPTNLRSRPRARNTDNLVRSATETRDIRRWLPPQSIEFAGGPARRLGSPTVGSGHSREFPPPPEHSGTAAPRPTAISPSNPCESGGVEAVEAGHARIGVGEVAGQRAQIAVRADELAQASDLGGGDRRPPQARVALEQRPHDLDPLLGLERAGAINQNAARPGQFGCARNEPVLQCCQ